MRIKRRVKSKSIFPVASMADIAFLLLIFFMLSSILNTEQEVSINLPVAKMGQQNNEKSFDVFITARGDYYFDGKTDTLDNLVTYALQKKTLNPRIKAFIKADEQLDYKFVHKAIKSIQDGGVFNIILASRKTK